MIVRMTHKAREKVKLDDKSLTSIQKETSFLDEWYVNIFTLNYKKYFILTEAKSLFSIVIDSKGINSIASFEIMLFESVNKEIGKINKKHEKDEGEIIEYCKTENKGVLGS